MMAGTGNFWEHVLQASLPVLKICMLGSVGALLAACGALDQHGRRTLSKLIYYVFTPALTFSKLAPVLTAQHLLLWMPLAVNMFLSVGVGLVLGVLLLLVVGAPPWFRKHVVVATALGNAGNLPLVLVAALLRESGGAIFEHQAVSVDLAIAYVAMGIWAATLTHFTVGTHLLKRVPGWRETADSSDGFSAAAAEAVDSRGLGMHSTLHSGAGSKQQQQQDGVQSAGSNVGTLTETEGVVATDGRNRMYDGASFCSVELAAPGAFGQQQQQPAGLKASPKQQGKPAAFSIHADSSSGTVALSLPPHQQQLQQQEQINQDPATNSSWQALSAGVANFLQKPQVTWQQQQQQQRGSSDLEHGERLRLLSSSQFSSSSGGAAGFSSTGGSETSAMFPAADPAILQQQHHSIGRASTWSKVRDVLGKAVNPLWGFIWAQASPPMVGCLLAVAVGMTKPIRDQLFAPAGHLHMLQDCIDMFSDCCIPCILLMMGATLAKGPGKACPPWRVVVGVSAARLLLLPLLGTTWILLAHKTGWLVAPDSMFLLVMLVQNAVPTALNVHTLATLHANREEEVGALLFWQYLGACFTVPAALMFFLWLLETSALAVHGAG